MYITFLTQRIMNQEEKKKRKKEKKKKICDPSSHF